MQVRGYMILHILHVHVQVYQIGVRYLGKIYEEEFIKRKYITVDLESNFYYWYRQALTTKPTTELSVIE
jgi:hypothetical protein